MAKPVDVKPEPRPARPDVREEETKRLSFTLTPDGKAIDWSKVRESRKPDIERMLSSDPNVRRLVVADAAPAAPLANRAMSDAIVDVLGQLEAALAVKLYGVTIDEALSVCQFSPAEKAGLEDPIGRVLNKYGSLWLTKYGDELSLAVILLSYSRTKLAAAQGLAARKRVKPPTRVSAQPLSTEKL